MSTIARTRLAPTLALTAAAVLSLLGLLGTAAPARADAPPPQLSIRVDDGRTDAAGGATLRHTVTVTNLGTKGVRDLAVSQTVPTGTKLASVGDGGTTGKGAVRWTVDVAAGRSVTLQTSLKVGKSLPPDLLRLATVACAGTSPKAPPTVCASDSDQLPAGAAAAEQQRQAETPPTAERPGWLLPGAGAAGVLLLVGAVVLAATRRTRRAARSAESTSLPRRGTGSEEVAAPQPSAGQVLQR